MVTRTSIAAAKSEHPLSHKVAWGLGLTTAAISIAPYILPWFGIGSAATLMETENLLHPHNTPLGLGMAGDVNRALNVLPFIGSSLATGVFFPLIASAAVGIGGVLLANWMGKHEQKYHTKPWSNIVRAAALTSSIIIALPSILTGLSTGLAFMALASGDMGQTLTWIQQTIGVVGGHAGSTGVMGAAIPHLLLCGASLLPIGAAYAIGEQSKHNTHPLQEKIPTSYIAHVTNHQRITPSLHSTYRTISASG